MSKNKTVFTNEELEYIPLTYRQMEAEKTKSVGELNVDSKYSKSIKHFSNHYIAFTSHKPISNFFIDDETI